MAKSVPAIFLDRDGTINVDHGYVHEIDNFEFIDGVIDAMRELKKMGFAMSIWMVSIIARIIRSVVLKSFARSATAANHIRGCFCRHAIICILIWLLLIWWAIN